MGYVAAHEFAVGVQALDCRSGLSTGLGRVLLPVPATHCQLPTLLATSASVSRRAKWAAPERQSR